MVRIRIPISKLLDQNIGQMKIMKLFRNPLKRKILGGFILDKKDQGKSKNKRENALALLKVWEEELKIKNEVDGDKMYSKEKNDRLKINDSKC